MSHIDKTGYHSYFHDHEAQRIINANPAEILIFMQNNPSLALRFIHDLVSRDNSQKALDALNEISPIDDRIRYTNHLYAQLDREFDYYVETGLPAIQRIHHAFQIPFILMLAQEDIVDIQDVSHPGYSVASEGASKTQLRLYKAGKLS